MGRIQTDDLEFGQAGHLRGGQADNDFRPERVDFIDGQRANLRRIQARKLRGGHRRDGCWVEARKLCVAEGRELGVEQRGELRRQKIADLRRERLQLRDAEPSNRGGRQALELGLRQRHGDSLSKLLPLTGGPPKQA